MNALRTLVSHQLIAKDLSKHQLASIIGYTNINKGLRVIDNFLNTLTDSNGISSKLRLALDIPSNDYELAIEHVKHTLHERAKQAFRPSVQVILSGRPSPIFAACFFTGFIILEDTSLLNFKDEINCICASYTQDQIARFSDTKHYKDSGSEYGSFVESLEKNELSNTPVPWQFGNGFRYFRAFEDTLTFDRKGRLINRNNAPPQASAMLRVNGKLIPTSFLQ